MSLRSKKDNKGFFLTCLGRPECNHAIWLADVIKEIKVLEQNCTKCRNENKSIAIKFKSNTLLAMLNANNINDNDRTYVSCMLCDSSLRVVLEVNDAQFRGISGGFAGNQGQANNRAIPSQSAARTNTNAVARPTVANPRPPPPNRTVPNPRPNPNANQSFRDADNAPKCSSCNGPVIK